MAIGMSRSCCDICHDDEFHYGSPGFDPRERAPKASRDIYIPGLPIECIK